MSAAVSAPPPRRRRHRVWAAALLAVIAVSVLTIAAMTLTAARPGGRMNPAATEDQGAHALVALLRDRGVAVEVAADVDAVEAAARPDTLLLIAETWRIHDPALLQRLADTDGDRLLVEPTPRALAALAPQLVRGHPRSGVAEPDCPLAAATRAGAADWGRSATYRARSTPDSAPAITGCYDGALVRYRDAGRTITVAGSADILLNDGLLREGNAALAMNLAGQQPRLLWYAPQHPLGIPSQTTTTAELIPDAVPWLLAQLILTVGLVALWKGRRLGAPVTETLPVVVRASETVEGRGRLYRAQRARDRAADNLRTATLGRLVPRLGLDAAAPAATVTAAVAQRSGLGPQTVGPLLFGTPPDTDADLLHLARALDDLEGWVTHS
ncbi:MAG TPA: DUF4350 domain-containing protein [Mycolicibacillus parakoreensis]|uniref:DUF4350 domain-containing protein n=2 Tax=Mycobacteriaceae TaxID=1762 RepID=A0ABY3U581_9MYCO|nr:DUF4350 domain-containing protein [Mycolicibacillus parakoreensis]ULN52906.1 hypothetical protein MIU77_00475 [Mycolicibacillus parakoreensis]HLR98754.1 DUF4350 domain-containing protein [Mycolicibacillus parakoreensis]